MLLTYNIAKSFSQPVEVVASFNKKTVVNAPTTKNKVFELLSRRPCTVEDIASGLGIKPADARQFVIHLLEEGKINKSEREDKMFYSQIR